MRPVYFTICHAIVTHPDWGTIAEMRVEKGIHGHALLSPCTNFPTGFSTNVRNIFFKCQPNIKLDT